MSGAHKTMVNFGNHLSQYDTRPATSTPNGKCQVVLYPQLAAFLTPRYPCVDWMGHVVCSDYEVINDHRARVG